MPIRLVPFQKLAEIKTKPLNQISSLISSEASRSKTNTWAEDEGYRLIMAQGEVSGKPSKIEASLEVGEAECRGSSP